MQNRSFVCNRSAVQYNALMKEWIGMYKFRGHERYAPLLTALTVQAFQAMSEEFNPVLAKETLAPAAHPEAATRSRQSLLQNNKPRWRPDAVTYVPVSDERLAERGFNQAERLAAGLAAAVRLPVVDLLQRRINTAKQSFKTRGERIQTMQDAFAMQPDGLELIHDLYQGNSQFAQKEMHSQPANSYTIGQEASSNFRPTTQGWKIAPIRLLMIDDIYTTGSTLDACGKMILNAGSSINLPIEIYTLTLARS
ncbi:ComF family protein [Paenibacillus sp. OK060]|uniref:ComF family protein n=1 Tax=Paenibacillus sp. OK060 TaxID=1881034 RepID=UPI00210BBB15|nr:ComF family protein [Paenibacillus sp. OK060]